MDWINTTVGEFCPFTYGKAIKKQEQLDSGTPVFGSNGVYTYAPTSLVNGYAVVIGRKGTVGKVHISESPCWVSDTAFYISYDSLEEAYFSYYLLSILGLEDMNTDAAVPGLNRDNAHRLEIKVPKTSQDRRELIQPLLTVDKKIEINQQINQTLEQMAQAIFKSWFVDFDPVKAKMAALEAGGSQEDATLAAMQAISGKDQAQLSQLQAQNPEQYNELRTTAELFPSAMQDSELGEIPDGWMVGSLSDIATFTNGRVQTSTLNVNNYVSTENMLENKGGIGNASSLPSAENVPSYEVGHILISNIRPYFKKIWLATHDGGRSPDVLGFENRVDGTTLFLYNFLYQDSFFEYMMLTSKGAKMPRGDKKAIMNLKLLVPPANFMRTFDLNVSGYYQAIKNRRDESEVLEALRDTLLPLLLSGEVEPKQRNCD